MLVTEHGSPTDAIVIAIVARSSPEAVVLSVEVNGVDRSRSTLPDFDGVSHVSQRLADIRRRFFIQQDISRLGLAVFRSERQIKLIRVYIRSFNSLLDVHAELDDVQKELQQILILGISSLDAKRQVGKSVFECHRWRERYPRAFAGFDNVEGIEFRIRDKTLHALTHAHTRLACDACWYPAAAGNDGHDPAFLVSCLDRSSSRPHLS